MKYLEWWQLNHVFKCSLSHAGSKLRDQCTSVQPRQASYIALSWIVKTSSVVYNECKESSVGDHLVLFPDLDCLANRILLRWLVRVFVPIWGVHRCNEERDSVTDEGRDFTVWHHASHVEGPKLFENLITCKDEMAMENGILDNQNIFAWRFINN